MAWTTTKKHEYAVGNLKMQLWTLSADSATVELNTGLKFVDHANVSIASGLASAAAYQHALKINKLSANTASNGYVSVTGAVSGNELLLTVWGH